MIWRLLCLWCSWSSCSLCKESHLWGSSWTLSLILRESIFSASLFDDLRLPGILVFRLLLYLLKRLIVRWVHRWWATSTSSTTVTQVFDHLWNLLPVLEICPTSTFKMPLWCWIEICVMLKIWRDEVFVDIWNCLWGWDTAPLRTLNVAEGSLMLELLMIVEVVVEFTERAWEMFSLLRLLPIMDALSRWCAAKTLWDSHNAWSTEGCQASECLLQRFDLCLKSLVLFLRSSTHCLHTSTILILNHLILMSSDTSTCTWPSTVRLILQTCFLAQLSVALRLLN